MVLCIIIFLVPSNPEYTLLSCGTSVTVICSLPIQLHIEVQNFDPYNSAVILSIFFPCPVFQYYVLRVLYQLYYKMSDTRSSVLSSLLYLQLCKYLYSLNI